MRTIAQLAALACLGQLFVSGCAPRERASLSDVRLVVSEGLEELSGLEVWLEVPQRKGSNERVQLARQSNGTYELDQRIDNIPEGLQTLTVEVLADLPSAGAAPVLSASKKHTFTVGINEIEPFGPEDFDAAFDDDQDGISNLFEATRGQDASSMIDYLAGTSPVGSLSSPECTLSINEACVFGSLNEIVAGVFVRISNPSLEDPETDVLVFSHSRGDYAGALPVSDGDEYAELRIVRTDGSDFVPAMPTHRAWLTQGDVLARIDKLKVERDLSAHRSEDLLSSVSQFFYLNYVASPDRDAVSAELSEHLLNGLVQGGPSFPVTYELQNANSEPLTLESTTLNVYDQDNEADATSSFAGTGSVDAVSVGGTDVSLPAELREAGAGSLARAVVSSHLGPGTASSGSYRFFGVAGGETEKNGQLVSVVIGDPADEAYQALNTSLDLAVLSPALAGEQPGAVDWRFFNTNMITTASVPLVGDGAADPALELVLPEGQTTAPGGSPAFLEVGLAGDGYAAIDDDNPVLIDWSTIEEPLIVYDVNVSLEDAGGNVIFDEDAGVGTDLFDVSSVRWVGMNNTTMSGNPRMVAYAAETEVTNSEILQRGASYSSVHFEIANNALSQGTYALEVALKVYRPLAETEVTLTRTVPLVVPTPGELRVSSLSAPVAHYRSGMELPLTVGIENGSAAPINVTGVRLLIKGDGACVPSSGNSDATFSAEPVCTTAGARFPTDSDWLSCAVSDDNGGTQGFSTIGGFGSGHVSIALKTAGCVGDATRCNCYPFSCTDGQTAHFGIRIDARDTASGEQLMAVIDPHATPGGGDPDPRLAVSFLHRVNYGRAEAAANVAALAGESTIIPVNGGLAPYSVEEIEWSTTGSSVTWDDTDDSLLVYSGGTPDYEGQSDELRIYDSLASYFPDNTACSQLLYVSLYDSMFEGRSSMLGVAGGMSRWRLKSAFGDALEPPITAEVNAAEGKLSSGGVASWNPARITGDTREILYTPGLRPTNSVDYVDHVTIRDASGKRVDFEVPVLPRAVYRAPVLLPATRFAKAMASGPLFGAAGANTPDDLVVAGYWTVSASASSGYVSVYRTLGSGVVGMAAHIPLGDGSTKPSDVLLADINNDSWSDIVVLDTNGNELFVLCNDQSGNFVLTSEAVVPGSHRIAAGDLDQDGHDDLIISEGSQMQLYGGGDSCQLTWVKTITISGASSSGAIEIADLDGANGPDVIAAHGRDLRIYLNGGTGELSSFPGTPSQAFADIVTDRGVGSTIEHQGIDTILVGNFDGGAAANDLFVAGTVYSSSESYYSAVRVVLDHSTLVPSDTSIYPESGFTREATPYKMLTLRRGGVVHDVDGDGLDDVSVLGYRVGTDTCQVKTLLSTGLTDPLQEGWFAPFSTEESCSPSPSVSAAAQAVKLDASGNGDVHLAALAVHASESIGTITSSRLGIFPLQNGYASAQEDGFAPRHVRFADAPLAVAADADADGWCDLIGIDEGHHTDPIVGDPNEDWSNGGSYCESCDYVAIEHNGTTVGGDLSFSFQQADADSAGNRRQPVDTAVFLTAGDFDTDGQVDVVVVTDDSTNHANVWGWYNENGVSTGILGPPVDVDGGSSFARYFWQATLGSVQGGKPFLLTNVTISSGSPYIARLWDLASPSFAYQDVTLSSYTYRSALAAGNFDGIVDGGSGPLDCAGTCNDLIACLSSQTDKLRFYEQTAKGTFASPAGVTVTAAFYSNTNFGVADFNGDGIDDLVNTYPSVVFGGGFAPDTTGYPVVLPDVGSDTNTTDLGPGTTMPGNNLGRRPVVADFNNDGSLDFATYDAQSGLVVILYGDGQGAFAVSQPLMLNPLGPIADTGQRGSLVVADFDNDGHLDLVFTNNASVISAYERTSTTATRPWLMDWAGYALNESSGPAGAVGAATCAQPAWPGNTR